MTTEHNKEYRSNWYKKNSEKIISKSKKNYQKHKEYYLEYNRKYRLENVDKNRDTVYKHRYGITLEDYNRMFLDQNGCCAICEKHQSEFDKRFAVDHDHETGKVRGLLCSYCNKLLGLALDKPELLIASANYLEKYYYI